MRKFILFILLFLSLTGCSLSEIDNTPTKQVEELFNNYQTLDQKVLDDLDVVIAKETSFTNEQKKEYREILKKHYQNLTYEIKDETVNGNKATVEVEIEVTDFYKAVNEGMKDNDIDSKLNLLKDAKDRVKYTLYLKLEKNDDGLWSLNDLSNEDEQKILGMYRY